MDDASRGMRLGMLEIIGEIAIDPVRIDGDEAILGRDPGSDIVLEDPRVSRRHARVWMDEHLMMIQDLGSRAGTVLNGTPITGAVELRTGDHLRLGLTELAVVWNPGLANTLDMPVVSSGDAEHPTVTIAREPSVDTEMAHDYRTVAGMGVVGRSPAGGVSSVETTAQKPGRRKTQAVVPPPLTPNHPSSGSGRGRGDVAEDGADLELDATADRKPRWLSSLLGRLRGRGR